MAVALADLPVLVVDSQFSYLIAADLTAAVNRVALGIVMAAGSTGATPFASQPPFGLGRHDGFWVLLASFISLLSSTAYCKI